MADNAQPQLRRTRFVCISDTHNASPQDGAFKLPPGDVLIHAGDLTKQGTLAELQRTLAWLAAAEHEIKLVVAGNHDVGLDAPFYAEHGRNFHNQAPQDPAACRQLLRGAPGVLYLEHEALDVRLARPGGPRTRFRVFGSPRSPASSASARPWAFQYPRATAAAARTADGDGGAGGAGAGWDAIPLDADVVVTHTPPAQHCDTHERGEGRGCEALRRALWRVRPRLAVCGHVHAARGAELVRWDLAAPHVRFKEHDTGYWADPSAGTKRMSYIDLSSRSGRPLQNDGRGVLGTADLDEGAAPPAPERTQSKREAWRSAFHFGDRKSGDAGAESPSHMPAPRALDSDMDAPVGRLGLGGIPPSARADVAALQGRLGRRETCVVNAAIMATSFPYPKGIGARRWNKPIVVDIDLPVADDDDSELGGEHNEGTSASA